MKNYLILLLSIIIISISPANLIAKKISIELRAFKDKKFIENFSEKDFEVYYKGKRKDIKDIFLISKNKASTIFGQNVKQKKINRNFVLIFSVRSSSLKIFPVIDYFFEDIIQPDDSLIIFTPKKTYNLRSSVLKKMSKKKIAAQLKSLLRRDINIASQRYISLHNNLIKIVKDISTSSGRGSESSVELALPKFREDLLALENLRQIHQKQVLDLIMAAGKKNGQNIICFFYDREFIPSPTIKDISIFKMIYAGRQNVINNISSLFEFYKRDPILETKKIKEKIKDLNLIINSIFFKNNLIARSDSGILLVEHSEDIFEMFTSMSKITGGKFDGSANLLNGFRNTIDYSENFLRFLRMQKKMTSY